MQMKILKQFLSKDFFLEVNALKNAEDLNKLGNKRF